MNLKLADSLKRLTPKPVREPIINLIFFTRSLFYKGNKVICPCCDNSFQSFYPSGKYGACPRCASGARHRLVYLYLKERTNFYKERIKVLHFAPEFASKFKLNKQSNLMYMSADINSARAEEKIDMTDIKYKDNFFDVILAIHVVEHIEDDAKALSEIYRVLNQSGWCIIQVPIDYKRETTYVNPDVITNKQRELEYGHFDHKRIYGKDYKQKLEQAGFIVNVDNFVNELPKEDVIKYGLNPDELIYYCTK